MRLLDHVSQAYERWGEVMMPVQSAASSGGGFGSRQSDLEVFSWSRLREVLRDVCGDANLNSDGSVFLSRVLMMRTWLFFNSSCELFINGPEFVLGGQHIVSNILVAKLPSASESATYWMERILPNASTVGRQSI